jgi:hypothetical protein
MTSKEKSLIGQKYLQQLLVYKLTLNDTIYLFIHMWNNHCKHIKCEVMDKVFKIQFFLQEKMQVLRVLTICRH